MCYNHHDSDPSFLGVHLILEIIKANLDEWAMLLENIKQVSKDVKLTAEDVAKLERYTDLTVSDQSTEEWYCLLRLTQGSFYHVLKAGYMENLGRWDGESGYVYVLDLDNKVFRAEGVGDDHDDDVVIIPLEKEELLKYAKEWSKGPLDESYDPEVALAKTLERKKMLSNLLKQAQGYDMVYNI